LYPYYKQTPTIQKEKDNPVRKWAKALHKHSTKEVTQMAKKKKRCSLSLVIREMQMEIAMIYYSIPTRTVKMKKTDNIKC